MIKKRIEDPEISELLSALEPDSRNLFLLSGGSIRGTLIHGTTLVNQMRANHELGILETLILGHAYLGAGLLTSTLKSVGKVSLIIECAGAVKGLIAECDADGNIRGYLSTDSIPVDKPLESFEISSFFGPGFLSIMKYQAGESAPYTGQVMLKHGNIAQDLAEYFLSSEQTPSSFTLSVKFDRAGRVVGAGGLFLQVLPGTDSVNLARMEERLFSMPSLGEYFADGGNALRLIRESFGDQDPVHLETRNIRFECSCTKERFGAFLASLPPDEKHGILQEGPFPLKTTCHNCNSTYEFPREEIHELFSN